MLVVGHFFFIQFNQSRVKYIALILEVIQGQTNPNFML